jgi:2-polyprenyl-6-methoxyphenol hydroxylase-like FAD-dependent oxidoreductase
MRDVSIDLRKYGFKIHKYDTGEVVAHQKGLPTVDEKAPVFNGHRGELHKIVFEYARALGIEIRLGRKAVGYFEDEGGAGVEFEDGEKVGIYLSN